MAHAGVRVRLTRTSASNARKVLIVGPAWVGDMVMAGSLVAFLARSRPGAEIHVLAPTATLPVAARIPGVAATHALPVRHGELGLWVRRDVGRTLAPLGLEQAIVLPNSWKSALCPLFARIPVRTGWLGEARYGVLNDVRRLDAGRLPRMVDRFVALGAEPFAAVPAAVPSPVLVADPARAAALRETFGLSAGGGVLALCPGAEYGPAKRWPARHFATVAAHHVRAGGSVWIFGAAGDRAAADALIESVPASDRERVHDLTGRTTLDQAIDLMGAVDCVVTNDSGLMHVAAALGRPLVAIYGSSSPEFTPPLAPRARVVREGLSCSPCFDRTCRFGHTRCLEAIEPARVIEVLDDVAGTRS